MRAIAIACAALFVASSVASAQTPAQIRRYNELLREYNEIRSSLSPQARAELDAAFAKLLGSLSANPYLPGSTSNPASRYDPESPTNPYGVFGSPYSPLGARNRYTTQGAELYGADGEYLGELNSNPYDWNSVANPYGPYGSRYSPTSVNNPYSIYGSPYSPYSATNPYGTQPPGIYAPRLLQPPRLRALPQLPKLPTVEPDW